MFNKQLFPIIKNSLILMLKSDLFLRWRVLRTLVMFSRSVVAAAAEEVGPLTPVGRVVKVSSP